MAIKKLPSTGDAPRSTGVPDSLVPGGPADSAGFPWEGRTFDHHGTAFADDDGATPAAIAGAVAELRAAVRAAQASETTDQAMAGLERIAAAHDGILCAFRESRVLVPMLAEAGDFGTTPEGRTVEKSQELSIVTVGAPDGRRVLPVFSSVAAMAKWHPEARPIPVPGGQAALAAVQEETDLIILDAASPELEYGVRRPALKAIALGENYRPAWADPAVEQAFRECVAGEPGVTELVLGPGDIEGRLLAPEVDVVIRVAGGLSQEDLGELLGRLQQRFAASETIAELVDSMRLVPRAE
ncbi:SseB family protein [Leucobacter sp. CSA2]|uniref:SseB family protein n=1 Tax=Leucobacter edaphi TaxID=2796472 RepID=A0A934UVT1_9MICO|nr:SseB family protein [Leucobacter edaphi]MBK0420904.1 SseB family protein [Leucobacter edaphi]